MILSVDFRVAVCMPTLNRLGLLTVVGRSGMGLDAVMIVAHAGEIIFERKICDRDCGLESEHEIGHTNLDFSMCIMRRVDVSNVLFVKNGTRLVLIKVNRNHAAIVLLCSR